MRLDWRWNYSSGQLDDWLIGDVDEFLVDWLPRKYSAAPEAGAEMCSAVADFFVHMGSRERLAGGVDRTAALVARAYALTDTVVAAMGFPTLADLADADAEDLVNVSLTGSGDADELLRRWRPDWSTAARAAALAEFAMSAEIPDQRLAAMEMLDMLEPVTDVEPAIRQMLDSGAAGHATMFLLERGLASRDELDAFIDIGPIVDLLSTVLATPDALGTLFAQAYSMADEDLIEELWRHDQPETIEILDALGKHLPDKKLAKSVRKAALKRRSWMANRHP